MLGFINGIQKKFFSERNCCYMKHLPILKKKENFSSAASVVVLTLKMCSVDKQSCQCTLQINSLRLYKMFSLCFRVPVTWPGCSGPFCWPVLFFLPVPSDDNPIIKLLWISSALINIFYINTFVYIFCCSNVCKIIMLKWYLSCSGFKLY